MLKYDSIHRISEFCLLKFIEVTDELQYFEKASTPEGLANDHYFVAETINDVVWDSGDNKNKLNKVYSNDALINVDDLSIAPVESKFINVHFMLKQGFNMEDIFGFHLIIKSIKTNAILLSRIVSNFEITNNFELISGAFWVEEHIDKIPDNGDILSCQITQLSYDDVEVNDEVNLGLIYKPYSELIPLIDEKPIPDYITNKITIDTNHYLKIEVQSSENKTIEQSILDYFELDYADIKVSHLVQYGNVDVGYKNIRVQNEDFKFGPINIGLNLLSFMGTLDINSIIEIIVSTEIYVDNKLIQRVLSVTTDLSEINPILGDAITHPTTNYPVEIVNETVINQNVIETKENTKILQIYQPIYVDFISGDIKVSSRNVSFDSILKETYLRVNEDANNDEQIIITKATVDNKYYLDLSELQPIVGIASYDLIDAFSSQIIGSGKIS